MLLNFVSYKASVGVYDPATGIWTIGNLTNKSNATLEITCIVLKTGVISNEVFVNGSTVDLNMTNNYGNVSVTVIPAPAQYILLIKILWILMKLQWVLMQWQKQEIQYLLYWLF